MQVDKNWEESVGKKLFEVEGELSPEAWNNISSKIQPQRRNRWFIWLPLVLLLFCMPPAIYFLNEQETPKTANNQIETVQNSGKKPALKITETGNSSVSAIAGNQENEKSKAERNTLPEIAVSNNQKEPTIINSQHNASGNSQVATSKTVATTKPINHLGNQVLIAGNLPFNGRPKATSAENNAFENGNEKTRKSSVSNSKPKVNTGTLLALNAANANAGVSVSEKKVVQSSKENPLEKRTSIAEIPKPKELTATKNETPVQQNNSVIKNESTGIYSESKPTDSTGIKNNATAGLKPVIDSVVSVNKEIITAKSASDTTANASIPESGKNWSFAVYATPQYTSQRILPNSQDEIMIVRMNDKNEFSTERIGYEIGLHAFHPVSEKVQLEFGFHFARLNQYFNLTTASALADSVVVTQQSPLTLSVYNREIKELHNLKYYYGGLFAGLNFAISEKLHLSSGIGLNGLLKARPAGAAADLGSRKLNPFLNVGLLYYQKMSSSVTLQLGPTMQYYLNPVQQKSALFGAQPTTFGFTIGLLFQQKP